MSETRTTVPLEQARAVLRRGRLTATAIAGSFRWLEVLPVLAPARAGMRPARLGAVFVAGGLLIVANVLATMASLYSFDFGGGSDLVAGRAVDVVGDAAFVSVSGGRRTGRFEHEDRPSR